MDEVRLSAETASVANQIRSIDREVNRLEEKVRDYLVWGLRGSGINQDARALEDRERDQLLQRRAELVTRLKTLTNQT